MRAVLLGSGGRESAMAWALSRSSVIDELVAAPGNPGIEAVAELVDIDASDPGQVLELARRTAAGLVVIGPEAPLAAGVADPLKTDGFDVFGPGAAAARIEGSKAYAKELMARAGIPTGESRSFTEVAPAISYLDELGPPYVIKADGLAAGKGVVVTSERGEAVVAIEDRIERRVFGDAGASIVIEEFLVGEEASLIAFSDGKTALVCEPAQDYKRVSDGDAGPNTGGMGSYSPVPACPPELAQQIAAEVIEPMVAATVAAGIPFVGALYAGLALTPDGPKVIEFNARFGDPETQALLPRLASDFGALCSASARGELAGMQLAWERGACVAVVLASDGYPGPHETGFVIHGLDAAASRPGVNVFHAGTARRGDDIVTAGGRVLAVAATGDSFASARDSAYDAAGRIDFEGQHHRSDIAARAVVSERSE